MDSSMHSSFHMGYYEWIVLALFWALSLVAVVLVVVLLQRAWPKQLTPSIPEVVSSSWHGIPEIMLIVLALPLELLWEIAGIGYTIYSEISNVRVKGTWGYTELMPIVPLIEVGGMPFLQWLLIPPVLLLLMRLLPSENLEPSRYHHR